MMLKTLGDRVLGKKTVTKPPGEKHQQQIPTVGQPATSRRRGTTQRPLGMDLLAASPCLCKPLSTTAESVDRIMSDTMKERSVKSRKKKKKKVGFLVRTGLDSSKWIKFFFWCVLGGETAEIETNVTRGPCLDPRMEKKEEGERRNPKRGQTEHLNINWMLDGT